MKKCVWLLLASFWLVQWNEHKKIAADAEKTTPHEQRFYETLPTQAREFAEKLKRDLKNTDVHFYRVEERNL